MERSEIITSDGLAGRTLMGPPTADFPRVTVRGNGIGLDILLRDEIDYEIMRLAVAMADRRRYGRAC